MTGAVTAGSADRETAIFRIVEDMVAAAVKDGAAARDGGAAGEEEVAGVPGIPSSAPRRVPIFL